LQWARRNVIRRALSEKVIGLNETTTDSGFADAANRISIAIHADVEIPVHDAISSLEMGLLPVREFSGRTATQRSNPDEPALRIEFIAPRW